ncbi:MAG: TlpA family protein disulfide reductase [candidate division WOR-3 bacterium]|nr:TlpA family protein disulfide reductase [candidate division WOR-3 bacterium]
MKNKILASIFLFIVIFYSCRPQKTPLSQKTPSASKMNFVLEQLDGTKISLEQYKGQVVLVDFWATWCPPCVRTIPILIDLYHKYKDRSFIILGVSLDESRDQLEKFVREKAIPYPILIGTREVASQFNIEGIPTIVIFDKKGQVRFREVGYGKDTSSKLENKILELLNE